MNRAPIFKPEARLDERPDLRGRFLRLNDAKVRMPAGVGSIRPRLLAFPFAGGSCLALRSVLSRLELPIDIWGVEYPGRGLRSNELPVARLDALVDEITVGICCDGVPTLLLGYSFGALVAYEVALRLCSSPTTRLLGLIAISAKAPHFAASSFQSHALPDRELITYLRRLDGTAPEILDNANLIEQFLPAIRADLCAYETYGRNARFALGCPVAAIRGSHDPFVEAAHAQAWHEYGIHAEFRCLEVAAGHFCHRDAPETLSRLLDSLAGSLVQSPIDQFQDA